MRQLGMKAGDKNAGGQRVERDLWSMVNYYASYGGKMGSAVPGRHWVLSVNN